MYLASSQNDHGKKRTKKTTMPKQALAK